MDKKQQNFWKGEFGDFYRDRHPTIERSDDAYNQLAGVSITSIFQEFFSSIDKKNSILELGCNIGLKLGLLQRLGFKNLYGVEINTKSYEMAKQNFPKINFVNASIEEFNSHGITFDLVYTSGVLIHIHPRNLESVIRKIVKLSTKYIFGFEYYSDELKSINYRGHSEVLWKQNFPALFKKIFPSLEIIKEKKFSYKEQNLTDIAYLIRK